ncbi:MAG TPA: family 43 glycosylhydrolase [Acidimicrobiales bacterium]|nr:family 43 glycosylhydrolase [Acidimicrobiales bacterium]
MSIDFVDPEVHKPATDADAEGGGDKAQGNADEANNAGSGGPRRKGRADWRRRVIAIVAVLVVVVAIGGRTTAKARLGSTEDQLAATEADLEAHQDSLANAQSRQAETQASITRVQGAIDIAVADRAQLETMIADLQAQIGAVDSQATRTAAAQDLVNAHSADARTCFDGVSSAVDANQVDNDQMSVTAMRNAAAACSRTLAYATGAVFPFDFADPFVLRAGGAYYGYSTNSGAGDIQVIRSTDLTNWEIVGNGLAGVPGWAAEGATWAPSVLARNGSYVVYYTVKDRASGKQCISRGVATSPAGPFLDNTTGPLVCQVDRGGSIDPSPFVDGDGRAYLLWKAEGVGAPQTIWSQELTADGLGLTGEPHALISADRSFERGVVEAPSMFREGGAYFLVYAAADWNSRHYTTAYATCSGPAGPCSKPADGRILSSGSHLAGPGGVEVFRDGDGALWVAFHAFSEPNVGYPSSRYLHLARLRVSGGGLSVESTT